MTGLLRNLCRAAWRGQADGLTDRQLLERFLRTHDELAFEALVLRHGPMVLAVCQRALGHAQDAEDAFQVTFLVLARKAATIRQDSVGNWLHGVAQRTARKALAAAARRRAQEKHMARPEAVADPDAENLRPLLDQALNHLPARYREPLILCDLEGNTRKAAAARLGWPEGTVSGRLARARVLLARRLARQGLTLTSAALAAFLSTRAAAAAVPAPLVSLTVHAATLVAAGQTATGVVSTPVATLFDGVLRAMLLTRLKTVTALVLALGFLAVPLGLCLTQPAAAPAQEPRVAPPAKEAAPPPTTTQPVVAPPMVPGLPTGPAPVQGLATLTDDKLVVKAPSPLVRVMTMPAGPAGGPGPAVAPAIARLPGNVVLTQTYDLKDVRVFDVKGNPIDKKDLPKLLKEETVVMVSWGQPADPLHLRVFKEGTLFFVVPMPAPGRVAPGGGGALPGGGGGGGGGGAGGAPGAPPATTVRPVPPPE